VRGVLDGTESVRRVQRSCPPLYYVNSPFTTWYLNEKNTAKNVSEVGRRKRRIVNTRVPRKRCSTVTSAESTLNKKGVTKNVRFFKRIDIKTK